MFVFIRNDKNYFFLIYMYNVRVSEIGIDFDICYCVSLYRR